VLPPALVIGCFLVLAMRARGAPLTKTDGKYIRHLGMGQKLSNIHWLVDKTMTMCKSYLTKTYLKISRASSCRCIGIAGRVRYNRGSFTWVLREVFGYLLSSGEGA
jgi:hypothetical protein